MDIIGIIAGLGIGVIITVILSKLFMPKDNGVDNKEAEHALLEKEKAIRNLEIENAKLESKLESIHNQYKKLENDLDFLEKNHESLSKEHASFQTTVNNLSESNTLIKEEKVILAQQKEVLLNENSKLSSRVSALEVINENLELQQKKISDIEKRFNTEFENIAGRLIKQNTDSLTENSSNSLKNILNPLKEDLERFKKNIDDKYVKEAESKASLKTEIENLIKLNEQLSDDAHNLTKALTGSNKHQGNWGEIVLERVLERSGLNKGSEYKLQEHVLSADGSKQIPDAVVFLPDNKHIIIDSKVSLTAYQRMVNADNVEEEKKELKLHVTSLKSHIKELGDKSYFDAKEFNSPDFTLMFLPVEASFSVALREDTELFNYAWEKNIVIVSPTTLLATLRTIESTWKHERQNKNTIEIARVGGTLYDKFVGFVDDLKKIEKGIKNSQSAYDDAFNKLQTGKGNLISQTERLKTLGAKAKKSLPSEVQDLHLENVIETITNE